MQIVGGGIRDGNVKLFSLAVLSEVSNIRFVSGEFTLCGVKDGDDDYPYMINWRTGARWRLIPGCLQNRGNLSLGMIQVDFA